MANRGDEDGVEVDRLFDCVRLCSKYGLEANEA